MFQGISAAAPILAIFVIAIGVQTVKLGLRVFGMGHYEYYAETLGLILVSTMVLTASLAFAAKIVDVFK